MINKAVARGRFFIRPAAYGFALASEKRAPPELMYAHLHFHHNNHRTYLTRAVANKTIFWTICSDWTLRVF